MLSLEGLNKIYYTITKTFKDFKVGFDLVRACWYNCFNRVTDGITNVLYSSYKLLNWKFINYVLNLSKLGYFVCVRCLLE